MKKILILFFTLTVIVLGVLWPEYCNVLMEMKRGTDTTEVLGTVELPQGRCEVCVSADAKHDEEA